MSSRQEQFKPSKTKCKILTIYNYATFIMQLFPLVIIAFEG